MRVPTSQSRIICGAITFQMASWSRNANSPSDEDPSIWPPYHSNTPVSTAVPASPGLRHRQELVGDEAAGVLGELSPQLRAGLEQPIDLFGG